MSGTPHWLNSFCPAIMIFIAPAMLFLMFRRASGTSNKNVMVSPVEPPFSERLHLDATLIYFRQQFF